MMLLVIVLVNAMSVLDVGGRLGHMSPRTNSHERRRRCQAVHSASEWLLRNVIAG